MLDVDGRDGESVRDRPRPLASREEIVPLCAALLLVPLEVAGGDLPFCPGLPFPPPPPPPPPFPNELVRISRRARAPKLVRRAKGVVGGLPPLFGSRAGPSSSAIADSLTLPLSAEPMLPRRPRKELNGEVWLGMPERPSVVKERRRLWAWAAAWEIGPGYCWVGGELLLLFVSFDGRETDCLPVPKRSAKVWPAKEERRARGGGDCGVTGSSAIVNCGGRCGTG